MFANIDVVRETIRRWQQIQLTEQEALAFAESAHSLRFDEEAHTVEPGRLLEVRRGADQGNDLWRVTNRIQENLTQGGQRFRYQDENHNTRRSRTRQIKGIDQDTKLNKAIWSLATKMEELKTK